MNFGKIMGNLGKFMENLSNMFLKRGKTFLTLILKVI